MTRYQWTHFLEVTWSDIGKQRVWTILFAFERSSCESHNACLPSEVHRMLNISYIASKCIATVSCLFRLVCEVSV